MCILLVSHHYIHQNEQMQVGGDNLLFNYANVPMKYVYFMLIQVRSINGIDFNTLTYLGINEGFALQLIFKL